MTVSSNVLRAERDDVYGTFHANLSQAKNAFGRFIPGNIACDLMKDARAVIELVKPRTIFDMVAYGGYLAQKNVPLIYQTNVLMKSILLELAAEYKIDYFHAGSSSEYGDILDAPTEDTALKPYTHYAVAKGAAAGLIHYFGRAPRISAVPIFAFMLFMARASLYRIGLFLNLFCRG